MQILISDANILIDMEEGEIIEQMFALPYQFSTPDILFFEELAEDHAHLPNLGLNLDTLNGETMGCAMALSGKYKKPSTNDCFALALAKQENCPLLTGDRDLRVAAENEQVEVRGSIWVVSELIKQDILTVERARIAFEKMKANGRRLPWDKAEELLK